MKLLDKVWKKRFLQVAALFAFLLLVYLLGPRVEVDTSLVDRKLPVSLGELKQLIERDAAIPGIIPQAEKRITFSDPATPSKTPLSIVYLHGFSATRQDTAPLASKVAQGLGANLFETRFTGHGSTDPQAMLEGSVHGWLNDTAEALEIGKRLGEHVIVIGTSTGATLATVLFDQHPSRKEGVAALVFVSPNFGVPDPNAPKVLWPWGLQIAKMIEGDTISWNEPPTNDGHKTFWTEEYPAAVAGPVIATVHLSQQAKFAELTMPLLMFYSQQDEVVVPAAGVAAFKKFGAPESQKKLVEMTSGDSSHHTLAGDILSPGTTDSVVQQILDFVNSL